MIVESSTKQYPTILNSFFDMTHLKTTPYPLFLKTFRRGELTRAQVAGAAPFPCPRPPSIGINRVPICCPYCVYHTL
eukprot:13518754-Ditylum_brightwellii.AAC.1